MSNSPASQATDPPTKEVETDESQAVDSQELEKSGLHSTHTADGYDANLIPAEVAARKEREGDNFKHLPQSPPGSESLDTTGGFTVDREGLVDNFGIEPAMYYDTPGDIQEDEAIKP